MAPPVHPLVERSAAYSWRLLVIAAVGLAVLWLLAQVWVLVVAVVIALYLARGLDWPTTWLRGRGLPAAVAALIAVLGFLGAIALVVWLIAPLVADEFDSLGPTISDAVNDLERWLVEDSPFDIEERDIEEFRKEFGDSVSTGLRSSSGALVSGAVVAVEIVTGILLGIITAFFLLKDGARFQQFALRRFAPERRDLVRRMGARAWTTLGGYLKGVAVLGTAEAAVIGITVWLAGGELVWPVAVLTFAAAFVPIVGAIVAGVVAVLVTLATAGFGPALAVAAVAIVVQQLDNDLLAPVIYGRALQLHPLVVLFSVVAGGALLGFGGTVLAVPVTAVIVNVVSEANTRHEAVAR
jgi:predicted PurR-regulated permease PerM